jgi:DNA-binding NarL/FixJ family response regulator
MMLDSHWGSTTAHDPLQQTARKFDQLQAEVLGAARSWAADEFGAAMAHQANDPLTALLLYLQQMVGSKADLPLALQETARRALREAERLCQIMRREDPENAPSSAAANSVGPWSQRRTSSSAYSAVRRHTLLDILTPREREVLTLITRGAANKEGAQQLGISKRTFEVHRAHIMEKLKARNAADLVRMALSDMR